MNFASDNWAGAAEPVITAVAEAARRGGPAYGGDDLTAAVERRFCEIFERDVAVFLVTTGTAANALGLAAFARPGGVIFCSAQAHVLVDEAGAAEFFGGGVKVVGLDGDAGRFSPSTLAEAIARFPEDFVHRGQPVAVSVTQITELGAAYKPGEIAALAAVAKRRDAAVHMDGARFAGAVTGLEASPADLTWRAGVDVMSFGATKNGCIAAEAVIFFDREHARDFDFARQRGGQGLSKNWFVAAQFDAYFKGDRWLDLARHANRMAARLAAAIGASEPARLASTPDANEVFTILAKDADARLRAAGAVYHPWPADGLSADLHPAGDEVMVRLVTSFQTTADEVDRFAAVLDQG